MFKQLLRTTLGPIHYNFIINIKNMQQPQNLEDKNKELFCKALASIIKKHRKKLEKSIYAISAESSVGKNTWRMIEKAVSKDPSIITIWKIAEGLDIYPDELLREVREKLGDDFSISGLN